MTERKDQKIERKIFAKMIGNSDELNQILKLMGFYPIRSFLFHHYLTLNFVVPIMDKINIEESIFGLVSRFHISLNYLAFLIISATGLADLSMIAYKGTN